jgi:hypothetical protein
MNRTIASITTSVDGYVTGPGDGPGCGLGVGGERLHHWVFGGPWTYDGARAAGGMSGEDKAFFDGLDVAIGGGADVIRQALAAGVVDELAISTAPVVLGAGKRLFDGFTHDLDLEILSVHHSPYAVHTRYAVVGRNS